MDEKCVALQTLFDCNSHHPLWAQPRIMGVVAPKGSGELHILHLYDTDCQNAATVLWVCFLFKRCRSGFFKRQKYCYSVFGLSAKEDVLGVGVGVELHFSVKRAAIPHLSFLTTFPKLLGYACNRRIWMAPCQLEDWVAFLVMIRAMPSNNSWGGGSQLCYLCLFITDFWKTSGWLITRNGTRLV